MPQITDEYVIKIKIALEIFSGMMPKSKIMAATAFTEMLEAKTVNLYEEDSAMSMTGGTVADVNTTKDIPKYETLCMFNMQCSRTL